jgi:Flp pilus assembly pilin Flp
MIDQVNLGVLRTVLAVETAFTRRVRREEGQAFVEYALVLTLVAVAVALLTQWSAFTSAISGSLGRVINVLKNNS